MRIFAYCVLVFVSAFAISLRALIWLSTGSTKLLWIAVFAGLVMGAAAVRD
jgi:hypothetical protein